jgi:hypothetical protein
MAAFQFYLQSGKQRRFGLVGRDQSHVVFGKKKNSLLKNKSETVRCRNAACVSFVAKVKF